MLIASLIVEVDLDDCAVELIETKEERSTSL